MPTPTLPQPLAPGSPRLARGRYEVAAFGPIVDGAPGRRLRRGGPFRFATITDADAYAANLVDLARASTDVELVTVDRVAPVDPRHLDGPWQTVSLDMIHVRDLLAAPALPAVDDGDRLTLDMDEAAEEIAGLISAVTGNEVDGDGDPWSIVLDHLGALVHVMNEARRRFLLLDAWLVDEYTYTPIGEIDRRHADMAAAVNAKLAELADKTSARIGAE